MESNEKTTKKASENKKERLKTGGGNPIIRTYNDVDNIIIDILGEQIDGLNAKFDSDAQKNIEKTLTAHTVVTNTESNNNIETPLYEIDKNVVECEQIINDTILFEPINVKLIPLAPNSENDDSEETLTYINNAMSKENVETENIAPTEVEAQTKLDFVLLQKEKFMEEHNLRMQILQKQLEYEIKK